MSDELKKDLKGEDTLAVVNESQDQLVKIIRDLLEESNNRIDEAEVKRELVSIAKDVMSQSESEPTSVEKQIITSVTVEVSKDENNETVEIKKIESIEIIPKKNNSDEFIDKIICNAKKSYKLLP